jgi:hypothetical protein
MDHLDIGENPRICAFHELWLSKCQPDSCGELNRLPSRSDFSFAELRPYMGDLVLVDVLDGGEDFKYRLVGVNITTFRGHDVTNTLMSAGVFSDAARVMDRFKKVIDTRAPYYQVNKTSWHVEHYWATYEIIRVPLAADGAVIDKIMAFLVFHEPELAI